MVVEADEAEEVIGKKLLKRKKWLKYSERGGCLVMGAKHGIG